MKNHNNAKSYVHRPKVQHFLEYWKDYLKTNGEEHTHRTLNNKHTTMLDNKDRLGILQALGLK